MKRLSTAELVRNFGSYSDTALAEPIVITKNGRDRLVLVSIDQFNALQEAFDDARSKVHRLALKRQR